MRIPSHLFVADSHKNENNLQHQYNLHEQHPGDGDHAKRFGPTHLHTPTVTTIWTGTNLTIIAGIYSKHLKWLFEGGAGRGGGSAI